VHKIVQRVQAPFLFGWIVFSFFASTMPSSAQNPVLPPVTPSDLKPKVDGLAENVARLDGMTDELRKSLEKLRLAIILAEKKGAVDRLRSALNEVKAAAEDVDPKITQIERDVLLEVQGALNELEKIESAYSTLAAIRLSETLSKALSSPGLIKPYRELHIALNALVTEVSNIVGSGEPHVNIIRAIFGDLESRDRNRTCDATAAIQKLCQGEAQCVMKGEFGKTFCAEDPVPNAAPRDKGVRIFFQCLDRIQQSFAPLSMPGIRTEGSGTYSVVLTNSDQSFSCIGSPVKPGPVK
jgi:hypothetical protein